MYDIYRTVTVRCPPSEEIKKELPCGLKPSVSIKSRTCEETDVEDGSSSDFPAIRHCKTFVLNGSQRSASIQSNTQGRESPVALDRNTQLGSVRWIPPSTASPLPPNVLDDDHHQRDP